MSEKTKAAKGATRALPKLARRDARVQTLLHDRKVRSRLRDGVVNARVAYLRATRRGDAAAALLDDRKGRRALRRAIHAFRDAFSTVRDAKAARRRRRVARVVIPAVAVGAAAVGARAASSSSHQ
jgi:hypothetical protein